MTQFSTLKEGLKIMLKENEAKYSAIPSTNEARNGAGELDAAQAWDVVAAELADTPAGQAYLDSLNEDRNPANEAPKRSQDVDAAATPVCPICSGNGLGCCATARSKSKEANLRSCKDCRVGRGYRPFLDYVELCPLHAAAPALYEALQATPCLKADFEGDTCKFWNSNYGQELCQRCAALALATDSAPAQDLGHNNDRKQ